MYKKIVFVGKRPSLDVLWYHDTNRWENNEKWYHRWCDIGNNPDIIPSVTGVDSLVMTSTLVFKTKEAYDNYNEYTNDPETLEDHMAYNSENNIEYTMTEEEIREEIQ